MSPKAAAAAAAAAPVAEAPAAAQGKIGVAMYRFEGAHAGEERCGPHVALSSAMLRSSNACEPSGELSVDQGQKLQVLDDADANW